MKKISFALALSSLLFSCAANPVGSISDASEESSAKEEESSLVFSESSFEEVSSSEEGENLLESLKEQYGDFSIEVDASAIGASATYDELSNTYVLAVCPTKAEYVFTGATDAAILIKDVNDLGENNYKGVKITLNGCALAYEGEEAVIHYGLPSKNVQISAKNGTENWIYNYGSGDGVYSENNIEVSGKGGLSIYTEEGHGMKAEGNIVLYGSNAINVHSGHDGFHCKKFKTVDEDTSTTFTGTVNVTYAFSQAFEGSSSSGTGQIDLLGGKFSIDSAESAFKTDVSLTIGNGVTVTANNLSADPVVQGDNAVGGTAVNVYGTFTVDGEAYTSKTIW